MPAPGYPSTCKSLQFPAEAVLRQVWVVLNLVSGKDNVSLAQQLLQVRNTEVGNTNRIHFAGFLHCLRSLPGVQVLSLGVEIARTVFALEEEWVVDVRVHGYGPVYEPQVDVVQSEGYLTVAVALYCHVTWMVLRPTCHVVGDHEQAL
jgi:hypothetical protein